MFTNLTKLYANGSNPQIIGRDKEMELLFLTMLRHEKPNALLLGEAGVGKTAIVHNLAYLIANDLCPKQLKGFQVLEVNTNNLLSGPGYRGVTEEKFKNMVDTALATGKAIIFLDEFHTVEHLGEMANGQTPGLGNMLKPYLTRPDFRVIGATNVAEKMDDKALLRRFFKITISEPTDEAIVAIITACIEKYGEGLKFKKEVIKRILDLSKTLDGFNPDKAKDITDFVCSYAKIKELLYIDNKMLNDFFDAYFLLKQKMEKKAAVIEA